MSPFDFFKKKRNEPPKPAAEVASDASLEERFQCARTVPQERVNELSNRFVAGGLRDFPRGQLNLDALDALSFDELCVVYNNTGWFASIAPSARDDAVAYRRFLRVMLLAKLSKMKLYTFHSPETELPIRRSDGALLLITDRGLAEALLPKFVSQNGLLREIAPGNFESTCAELLCTGYDSALINVATPVKLAELIPARPLSEYGNICPDACARMILFRQTALSYRIQAKAEQRGLSEAESGELEKYFRNAMVALSSCSLLLPAEFENGRPARIYVPRAAFPDGSTYAALFTDQWAVNRFYREPTNSISFPGLLRDQCGELAKSPDVTGIIINPGCEEFTMTRAQLEEYFSSQK